MASSDQIDVGYVADLARIQLSKEETDKFQKQLGDILEYVGQINEVDISAVPDAPVDPSLPVNALRKDAVRPSLEKNQALANVPAQTNDLIIVPKIVE